MKNILFVDDESFLLDMYKDFFESKGDDWNAFICSDSNEVVNILKKKPIDIIISDYNMPNMDGGELLAIVKDKFPWVIRIIFTGGRKTSENLQAVKNAHRCFLKPIKMKEIESEIENIYFLFNSKISRIVRTTITGIDTLPVMPKIYNELVLELKKGENASLNKIAKLIANDPSMTLNILKIINSPFFISKEKIKKPEHAVTMLGLNIVKEIVLTAELISIFPLSSEYTKFLDGIIKHSTFCSSLMKNIFDYELTQGNVTSKDVETAGTIGMLHDIGKIILASMFPDLYKSVIDLEYVSNSSFMALEKKTIGVNNAEVASYLLSLWSLPSDISQTLASYSENLSVSNSLFLEVLIYVTVFTDLIDNDKIDAVSSNSFLNGNDAWLNIVRNTMSK